MVGTRDGNEYGYKARLSIETLKGPSDKVSTVVFYKPLKFCVDFREKHQFVVPLIASINECIYLCTHYF